MDAEGQRFQEWSKGRSKTMGARASSWCRSRFAFHIVRFGGLCRGRGKDPNEIQSLPSPLHYTLVLTCAATALRSSEILALRWADVQWHEGKIQISKRWAKGEETKTNVSDGDVALHPALARYLRAWQRQTPHAHETDFVFPSLRARGRKPLCSSVFVADHLRPAAKKAGVHIEDGQRFGLHNLRHSLSNWLVNKAKVEPKTRESCVMPRFRRRSIYTRRKTAMKHEPRRANS